MEEISLEYPIWTIGATFLSPEGEDAFSVIRINDADCGPCMPLFADVDLAEEFIEQAKTERRGEYQTIMIENPKSLAVIVGCLAQKGCRYVVVNCFLSENGKSVAFVPVETVIEACREWSG